MQAAVPSFSVADAGAVARNTENVRRVCERSIFQARLLVNFVNMIILLYIIATGKSLSQWKFMFLIRKWGVSLHDHFTKQSVSN